MRVALELQPCCGTRTGIGNYTYELARRLIPSGDIHFQGDLFNFAGRHDNSALHGEIPFPIVERKLMPYGIYRRLWQFLPMGYEAFFGEADIFHFFNYIVPPRIRGKVITTVHDMTHIRFPETVDRRNLSRLQRGLDYSIERSESVMTSSEFSKSEIVALCGVPEKKIRVIHPAPSVSGGTCDRDGLFRRLGIRGQYILYLGSIEPRKNLTRLLLAYQKLRDRKQTACQLVLCGAKGWNNEGFYSALEKLPCRDDVLITGYLPEREKNTLLSCADAFVFPSLYEGFGMPPLEAMYWGTPVVCSRAASMPEAAGEAACYVDPLSVESIAEGIEKTLNDRAYAGTLAAAGRERVRSFSWERSAAELLRLYRETGER